jgi:hypothetical protein
MEVQANWLGERWWYEPLEERSAGHRPTDGEQSSDSAGGGKRMK